ncbi:MAG TPA: hypothetical protein VK698_39375 [Kofleriaceae bacterium]|nr:hypothetical protein [Kofleriaceae bacterium]
MSSGFRSWEERNADTARTRAEAAKLTAEAKTAEQNATVGAAKVVTDQLAEQIKQTKLRNQLADVKGRADDDKDRRQARRREQRADDGTTFKVLVNIVMTLGLLAALPAQMSYFLTLHRKDDQHPGYAWTLTPVPFFLELLAWVGVMGTRWAHRKGLPRWPFWLMTAALASVAGYINLAHGSTEYGIVAGIALAATSIIGPLLAEVRQFLETKAAEDGRTLQQRARDRRTAREESKQRRAQERIEKDEDGRRKELFKDEFDEFRRIIAAHPTGGISRESAWEQAWDTMHLLPLSVTVESLASREVAREAIEEVMADHGSTRESLAVDLWLAEIFPPDRGDDGPAGAPAEGAPIEPTGGGSRARSERHPEGTEGLVGKRKQAPRGSTNGAALKPLDDADLEKVRKLAAALGSAAHLSHSAVKKAVGGGRNEYLARLRKTVQAEARQGQAKPGTDD